MLLIITLLKYGYIINDSRIIFNNNNKYILIIFQELILISYY